MGGGRVQLWRVLQAGCGLAPHRELVHLLGPGEKETEGQGGLQPCRTHPSLPDPCGGTYAGSMVGQVTQTQHALGGHASWAMEQGTWDCSHVQVSCPGQGTWIKEAQRCPGWGNGGCGQGQPSPWAPPENGAIPHPWGLAYSRYLTNYFSGYGGGECVPTSCGPLSALLPSISSGIADVPPSPVLGL